MIPPLPVIVLAFGLRGALHALRSVASARLGAEVDDGSLGLAFGLLSSIHASSLIIGAWLAGFLFEWNPLLPFLTTLLCLPPILLVLWRGERRAAVVRAVPAGEVVDPF